MVNDMLTLTYRHIKLFLKDPANVFLCLISAVVILGLYVLFIRDFMIEAILETQLPMEGIEEFVDSLMTCGLMVVVGCTGSLPITCLYVKDKASGVMSDFYVAPIARFSIFLTYEIAAFICSFLLSIFTLVLVNGYFMIAYDMSISLERWFFTVSILTLAAAISALLMMLGTLFFSSSQAYASFANLCGVIVGFLAGVYIPIGYYPQAIRDFLYFFPLAQATSILKYRLNQHYLPSSIPLANQNDFFAMFGCKMSYQGVFASINQQILLLVMFLVGLQVIIAILFYVFDYQTT